MLGWFYGLALGAERFEHFTRHRRDRLLGELLGIERFASADTMRRLFLSFNYSRLTEVSERLMRFSLLGARPILLGHTLDLDSAVFCRYGGQQGEFKGLQSEEAEATIPSSVGGVFGRSKKVIMGEVTFWEHRECERVCGVHETGANAPFAGASNWVGPG